MRSLNFSMKCFLFCSAERTLITSILINVETNAAFVLLGCCSVLPCLDVELKRFLLRTGSSVEQVLRVGHVFHPENLADIYTTSNFRYEQNRPCNSCGLLLF